METRQVKSFQLLIPVLLGVCMSVSTSLAEVKTDDNSTIINGLIANIENQLITFEDIRSRHSQPAKLTYAGWRSDKEAKEILDFIILEKLIELEAKSRRVSTSPEEVDYYIDQIAARNGLSRAEFEKALLAENKTMKSYQEQARVEILKSKLASKMFSEGVGVPESEIDQFVESNPAYKRPGDKIRLSQIMISNAVGKEAAARKLIAFLQAKLAAGENFARLAAEYSESPEAREGGSLGIVNPAELNPAIAGAVAELEEGGVSPIVVTPRGFHLFRVDKKYSDNQDEIREEAKAVLKQHKLDEKLQKFFTTELYDKYVVEML